MEIGRALGEAWATYKQYPVPLTVGYFLAWAINSATSSLLLGPTLAGFAELTEQAFQDEEPQLGALFKGFERLPDKLLTGLAALSGALLCGIGILVTGFLFLYAPVIVQLKQVSWQEACTESKDLVLAHFGSTVLLVLLFVGLNLLGTLACCVGTFVTMPLSQMTVHACYHQLIRQSPLASGAVLAPSAGESP
ncbi:MAG: hypothetical protein RBU45_03245 [Myxococcota bacterium]|jgi:hypothetical protein|nr:hypothetical protein [Myxococcota bacterium]